MLELRRRVWSLYCLNFVTIESHPLIKRGRVRENDPALMPPPRDGMGVDQSTDPPESTAMVEIPCHSQSKEVCRKQHPECTTGLSCLHQPVCFKVIAHKTRKRFATKIGREDVDALTIQRFMGHSSFATTQGYLADLPNPGVREKVNRAFA